MTYRIGFMIAVLWMAANAVAGAEELVPFELKGQKPQTIPGPTRCEFAGLKVPDNAVVYAAGSYAGRILTFQIDQSGHEATQIDVAVNSPAKPVILMLGAYEPTIWNIGWTQGTKIVAALVSGYHRQAVAGLSKDVPVLISTFDNKGACGYFYVSEQSLEGLSPRSRTMFGRPVAEVSIAKEGTAVVGEALGPETKIVTSPQTPPEAYFDKKAPLAGPAGLEDAVVRGILRKATEADADAWVAALMEANPDRDVPPIAGKGKPTLPRPSISRGYVVLKEFVYPSGLYGGNLAIFFIPKGVPSPIGNPGHSAVYDFNTLRCQGAMCGH
jgi:hypothetical protein